MGRPQQRARKKQPSREKISGLGDGYPKSIEEFISTNSHAFRKNFRLFLKKYKDESKGKEQEQRLDFAIQIAGALSYDKDYGPNLAKIGRNFSGPADPKFTWLDDLLEGCHEAETLISYLKYLFNKDQTALDFLSKIYSYRKDEAEEVNFHTIAREALIGCVVTSRHKTYRIDDIAFAATPSSTTVEDNSSKGVSGVDMKDHTQPLLVCMVRGLSEGSDGVQMQGVYDFSPPKGQPFQLEKWLTYEMGAKVEDLRIKKGPNLVVMKEVVDNAYRWVMQQLDVDFEEYKGFREGLHEKERQKWDKLIDKLNEFEDGDATQIELVNTQKEIENIIARFKSKNRNLDVVVDFIEGKPLGAVPKKEKEKSVKSNKKGKNRDTKCKDGKANVNDESLIQGDIVEAPYQEEASGDSGRKGKKNRKKPDTNSNVAVQESVFKEFAEHKLADSIETQQLKSDSDSINIVVLKKKEILNVTKAQVDETKNGLRAEPLKNSEINFELTSSHQTSDRLREDQSDNSQLNFKVTSANQESDKSSKPLKEVPVRSPNQVREEVRDRYIKDILEVNEKVENMKQEMIKNDEIKARQLKDLKTKQDQEKVTLNEESARKNREALEEMEKLARKNREAQEEMEKLKQEMSRIKKEMSSIKKKVAETEAKLYRKKQDMSARHIEENEAVREMFNDQESQKTLANLMKASAELTDDMKKLDIDSNVVKQVDDVRGMLECPICMEEMKPPTRIWMCEESHCVCEKCKGLLPGNLCPTCRSNKVSIRARTMEDLARALYKQ